MACARDIMLNVEKKKRHKRRRGSAETVKGHQGGGLNSCRRKEPSGDAFGSSTSLSPVQIEAGSSESACNDAVNSPLAKSTLFERGGVGVEKEKEKEGSLLLISAQTLINT